jgi:hypothetical protein
VRWTTPVADGAGVEGFAGADGLGNSEGLGSDDVAAAAGSSPADGGCWPHAASDSTSATTGTAMPALRRSATLATSRNDAETRVPLTVRLALPAGNSPIG